MHYYWPREPQGRELENLTQLFKVLGDPSRMKVLFQIGSSEACVTEVAARLNMSDVLLRRKKRGSIPRCVIYR